MTDRDREDPIETRLTRKARPDRLARQLDETGIAAIAGFFSRDEIAEAAAQVRDLVRQGQNSYVARVGGEGMTGNILARLATSPDFETLCAAICRQRRDAGDSSIKQVLRCLSGSSGVAESNYFHFDSYAITVIVPIIMPDRGAPGDLVFFPRFRRRPTSYIVNVVQKALLDLPPAQALLRRASRGRASRARLIPGAIYFLDGGRALHANEPCDPTAIRATLVIHFAETHRDHWLKRRRAARIGEEPIVIPAAAAPVPLTAPGSVPG